MEVEILNGPIKNYVDIISKKYKLKKRPINRFIKKQNWSFKTKIEDNGYKIGVDNLGKKYYIINDELAIVIENN
tara:strand:- start:2288 stop:2509 length:222 start_codon:yes stop_codon:yes gene_type:complete